MGTRFAFAFAFAREQSASPDARTCTLEELYRCSPAAGSCQTLKRLLPHTGTVKRRLRLREERQKVSSCLRRPAPTKNPSARLIRHPPSSPVARSIPSARLPVRLQSVKDSRLGRVSALRPSRRRPTPSSLIHSSPLHHTCEPASIHRHTEPPSHRTHPLPLVRRAGLFVFAAATNIPRPESPSCTTRVPAASPRCSAPLRTALTQPASDDAHTAVQHPLPNTARTTPIGNAQLEYLEPLCNSRTSILAAHHRLPSSLSARRVRRGENLRRSAISASIGFIRNCQRHAVCARGRTGHFGLIRPGHLTGPSTHTRSVRSAITLHVSLRIPVVVVSSPMPWTMLAAPSTSRLTIALAHVLTSACSAPP